MKQKYIELLLKRCLDLHKGNSLFINYDVINKDFVNDLVELSNSMGIKDIYLDEHNFFLEHDVIKNTSIDDIESIPWLNCNIWDEYAKKGAAFLMLDTEFPNVMDDIESDKIAKCTNIRRNTKPLYREMALNNKIPWCIAAVPNEYWAKDIFFNSQDPLYDFWNVLASICLLDKENPIEEWNKLLDKRKQIIKVLNDLRINKLYYKNGKGTNLEISLPNNHLWQASSEGNWIVNIPSYEIFTSPDYRKTNGIVFSSKPLLYNGALIDNFYIEFKKGKVINFDAEVGKNVLKEIINSDQLSSYLGEVALVNYDSPINNTNILFKTTLLDENASCHLALGAGFTECIQNGDELSKEELDSNGINLSKNHVDFMIGTKDLQIEADTKKGRITIMKDGNLII